MLAESIIAEKEENDLEGFVDAVKTRNSLINMVTFPKSILLQSVI